MTLCNLNLHIVIALKEVGNLAFADLGISKLASRSSSAKYKVVSFGGASLSTLVGVDQLLNSITS